MNFHLNQSPIATGNERLDVRIVVGFHLNQSPIATILPVGWLDLFVDFHLNQSPIATKYSPPTSFSRFTSTSTKARLQPDQGNEYQQEVAFHLNQSPIATPLSLNV